VAIEGLNHYYGEGELRQQILFDVSAQIQPGEIVLLTGPSGSGKTTLLTLIGALRTAQEGSLQVLGHELRGANERTLTEVRKRIGYIFQAHNLLGALTAAQNVQMALQIQPGLTPGQYRKITAETLGAVGLGEKMNKHPGALSGGEKQRVAIARALAGQPDIILADEPTASLDKHTGREIVELLRRLAREQSVTVILVTHDNRILDIADRILTLEDGRLSSLMNRVSSDTHRMLQLLLQDIQKGHFMEHVAEMPPGKFMHLLEKVTTETQELLDIVSVIQGQTFVGMIRQVVDAAAIKMADIMQAEKAALCFIDPDTKSLWSWNVDAMQQDHERTLPSEGGILNHVIKTGKPIRLTRVSENPHYLPAVDGEGVDTLLAMPVNDSQGNLFAIIILLNKREGSFSEKDEQQLKRFTKSAGLILESWWRMGCDCRSGQVGRQAECCRINEV
jgi:putative ABC transport system ATP-binding protein